MTNEEKTISRFEVRGVNDDRDFCECCGKHNLKKVVWIEDKETGAIQHFGTTCAENPAKAFGLKKEIKAAIVDFENKVQGQYRAATQLYKKAGGKYVCTPGKWYQLQPADPALYAGFLAQVRAANPITI